MATKDKTGFVYLIRSGEFYKIGRAKSLPARLSQLTPVLLPFPIELIHTIYSENYIWAESFLHKEFSHLRMNGEWFNLRPGHVNSIKSILRLEPGDIVRGYFPDLEDEDYAPDDIACFIDHLDAEALLGFLE